MDKYERQVRQLIKKVGEQGYTIRREKLARGLSFRVKSGLCKVSEEEVFYLDKRLEAEQQYSILQDFLQSKNIKLDLPKNQL